MYEKVKDPFIGQRCWHSEREDFGLIVAYTSDPGVVVMDFDGQEEDVSVNSLVRSIFAEDNRNPSAGYR